MPPIELNRRRFLGCSAAAGLAFAQGKVVESGSDRPIGVGLIGVGNRGTALLRAALELSGVKIVAIADEEAKHRVRAQNIVEKTAGTRPEAAEGFEAVLRRPDIDALIVALPCDLHAEVAIRALEAGKHLYLEKPLALSPTECEAVVSAAERAEDLVVRVGFQRRWNPRYRAGVDLIRNGELGELIEGRAAWISSNGPINGHRDWLARRERSGDWMVEQAVHVWDLFHWIKGGPPIRAYGLGRRDVFAKQQPKRNVTDHYRVTLEWPDGFHLGFIQSWLDPPNDAFTGASRLVIGTEGGFDFSNGTATFRDRSRSRRTLHPGALPDTRFALDDFLREIRAPRESRSASNLKDAAAATLTGLLVRAAVDERRVVNFSEIV